MKEFKTIKFDAVQCRQELERLRTLLQSQAELSERDDLLPLFKDCPQLAAFIGSTVLGMGPANRLAYEFNIFGDFMADIVIGNFEKRIYCAIEMEEARPDSILARRGGRATREWGHRLERGFGQLIDWFFSFDDHKNSAGFSKHFGFGHVDFVGLVLVGRAMDITEHERTRIRWRSDRVTVNTHKVYCRTYDELFADLDRDLALISG